MSSLDKLQPPLPPNSDLKLLQLVMELQDRSFDRSTIYTTVVIFGGYAGLFTLLGMTKGDLSSRGLSFSGIFLIISMSSFIAFEVVKMIFNAITTMRMRKIILSNRPSNEIILEITNQNTINNRDILKFVIPIWYIMLFISIVFGVGSAFILLNAFFCKLMA